MKPWFGLILVTSTFLLATPAPSAWSAPGGRDESGPGLARSFQLGDLGDLLGLGGGGLGSLGDLLGLGGDSLGGLLGGILGGLGGRDDRSPYGYSDDYDGYEYDSPYRRPRSRSRDRDRGLDQIFGRLDLGGNGFVERPELRRFARRGRAPRGHRPPSTASTAIATAASPGTSSPVCSAGGAARVGDRPLRRVPPQGGWTALERRLSPPITPWLSPPALTPGAPASQHC